MSIVAVGALLPGMQLAQAVLSPQGAILAGTADKLTAKQIRLFKMWGVTEAAIIDNQGSPLPAEQNSIDKDSGDSVDHLFGPHLGDPNMRLIAAIAREVISDAARSDS